MVSFTSWSPIFGIVLKGNRGISLKCHGESIAHWWLYLHRKYNRLLLELANYVVPRDMDVFFDTEEAHAVMFAISPKESKLVRVD